MCVHHAEAAIQRVESAPAVARSNSYKSLHALLQRLHIAAKNAPASEAYVHVG